MRLTSGTYNIYTDKGKLAYEEGGGAAAYFSGETYTAPPETVHSLLNYCRRNK